MEKKFHIVPRTGKIVYKKNNRKGAAQAGWIKPGSRSEGGGYRMISVAGRRTLVRGHHLVWAWVTGNWPDDEIDHRNGKRDDNRISNLRQVTVAQNRINKVMQSNNKSGYKWVHWDKQRNLWKAEIREPSAKPRRRRLIFYFAHSNPKVAYEKACEAAKKIYGEFFNPGT